MTRFGLLVRLVGLLLALWLGSELAVRLGAEALWFQEVGYFQVFLLRLKAQVGLGTIAFGLSALFLFGNLLLAKQFQDATIAAQRFLTLGLRGLLPIATGLSLLLGLLIFHGGRVAFQPWQPDRLDSLLPPLPSLGNSLQGVMQFGHPWQGGLLLGGAAIVLVARLLWVMAFFSSLGFGLIAADRWSQVLLALHAVPFQSADPLFKQDISFYIFGLPLLQGLRFWLVGLALYALVSVALVYLLSGNSLSQGQFLGFSPQQLRHLGGLVGLVLLTIAFSYWLSRYELVYSTQGVVYGASYTDVAVQRPLYTVISVLSLTLGILCLGRSVLGKRPVAEPTPQSRSQGRDLQRFYASVTSNRHGKASWLLFTGVAGSLGVAILLSLGLPVVIQRAIVQPNELAWERPYIQQNIAFTRAAFNLADIEVKTFDPQDDLTYADLLPTDPTVRNIRLWDTRPLLATNRQLQQIRPYYTFPSADIDRYTLQALAADPSRPPEKQPEKQRPEKQQVLIAARELDYGSVPPQAQTWVNQHLVYTHGYGFTLSPVNRVGAGGLPDYFVKDIGTSANPSTTLNLSSDRIRASIPVGQPRIYYGEITNTYIMTATKVQELDYPSVNANVYNTYDGKGGIALHPFWRRWLFSRYLHDWQMLLTQNFTPQTKLLFRRNINQRLQAIAPFLKYDSDPYLVVTDVAEARSATASPIETAPNYLYWIIDAYTTSAYYPNSEPNAASFNYIRNSVKVVVDAYNGSIDFYIADPHDSVIQSWAATFPQLLKPLDQMPAALRSHLRYPASLLKIQAEQLNTYHMTDPQVFYNREDQWQIPNEVYGNQPQRVEPYYLIMKLPMAEREEFVLLLPFTPKQRNNLIAWIAARSDGAESSNVGDRHYGKVLLYQFPKQQLVYGPEQIEARINQDPVISQQISLWNRQGSRAIQGNLLVIPIKQSLLYVEPLYLEAELNSIPTLVRVIVAYENKIVMAATLDQALRQIFQ